MRDPDSVGWTNWEATVATHGREYVRRGFEESGEFSVLIANMVPNGSATANASSLISSRVDPRNQPGNGMLTRDASWSVPLLSLRGRAGLDLGLALSYSSQVWTRSGPYIYFDEDNGFPSPGFRLGFPTVQRKVFDAQTARKAYLLITASGRRVELRQAGTSNIYDAADSSYLRLTDNGSLVIQSTDGTRPSFTYFNGEYRCSEVKDRNGNYITVNYNSLGQITTIVDTLGRVITFNYDGNANLLSITQSWAGQPSHQWVSFGWSTRTMQSSFSDSTLRGVIGTANGTVLPVITQVALNDTSHFTFDYTNSLQLSVVRNYFGTLERNSTSFSYETPTGDAPRLLDSRVSAHNWTGINNVPSQVITQYSVAGDGACVMTAPDGTIYKEYYGTGWQKGLTTLSEVWSGGVRRKWTTTAWTQDDTNLPYSKNPRPYDTSVYDEAGNRRRVETIYSSYNLPDPVALPTEVKEYAAGGTNVLRRTTTTYFDGGQAYIDRRVLGLLREVIVYNANNQPQSKVWYDYDWGNEYWVPTAQAATQHDASGTAPGRGNLCWIGRWDVTDINNFDKHTRSFIRYNRTGSVIATADHDGHGNTISYSDSFSDAVNRNTFAYPTTVTDAGGFSSNVKYNFDFGATTRTQSPAPAGQLQGAIQTMTYNNLGQLQRVTTTNNNAYKRFWYGDVFTASYATVNNATDESYSIQTFDGLGRPLTAASNHPGSTGGYKAQLNVYDLMGRIKKTSNPAETTSGWVPAGDDAAGWLYSQQTYDWQGRPLVTTHPNGTTKEASYAGCGCAGTAVVTLTDEGTIHAGIAKRRQQKIHSDVLGRTVKTEILNWDGQGPNGTGGSVYSATVNTYNARDQITQVRVYAGPEGSGTYQDTITTFDGHGRLKTRRTPEQTADTVWTYNADDTVNSITDARGASQTFGYNSRHLITSISYAVPGGSGISVPASVTFEYDAAGNRTKMTDGFGNHTYGYDQLSRLTSETRTFTGLTGSFAIGYGYNLANQLTSLSEPTQFGATFSYVYDTGGRLTSVNGSAFAGVTSYASNAQYRAWGTLKHLNYGNSKVVDVTYNSRLQAVTFNTPGVITKSYDYYADGALRFSSDSTNHKWDRFYSYDHVGRIREAFSGAEARFEGQTTNRPYRQTFSYDGFNHITNQLSLNWSTNYSTSNTYTNNRNDSWNYDAQGNLLAGINTIYSYDAAGRIRTVSTSDPDSTTARSVDGDGQQVKTEHVSVGEQGSVTTICYYLRSSVLQGQVLTEIGSTGAKKRTFVYAGNSVLAWQVYYGVNPGVVWQHQDPSQASFRTSDIVGQTVGHSAEEDPAELDPVGANAGLTAPLIEPVPPAEGNGSLMPYPSHNDPARPDLQYAVDGIPVPVDYFRQQLDLAFQSSLGMAEAAARASNRAIGSRNRGISWGTPFDVVYDESGRIVSQYSGNFDPALHDVNYGMESRIYGSSWGSLGSLLPPIQPLNPQNPDWRNNNPDSIGNDTKFCSITVSFTGRNRLFTNGSGARNIPNVEGGYGVGFTVTGRVNHGEIGRVERRNATDIVNPNGSWTLQQWVSESRRIKTDLLGDRITYGSTETSPDGPSAPFREINGNRVTYFDFPGPITPFMYERRLVNITSFYGEYDFAVKLVNGRQECEVKFHLSMVLRDGVWTASWGSR